MSLAPSRRSRQAARLRRPEARYASCVTRLRYPSSQPEKINKLSHFRSHWLERGGFRLTSSSPALPRPNRPCAARRPLFISSPASCLAALAASFPPVCGQPASRFTPSALQPLPCRVAEARSARSGWVNCARWMSGGALII
jgi:hypothetical protein